MFRNKKRAKIYAKVATHPVTKFFFPRMQYDVLMPLKMLRMHTHIVGATGSWKTRLLTLIAHWLIEKYQKFSFVLLDVHGDISKKLKRHRIFAKAPDRLVYINPFFRDWKTPRFNFFEFGNKSLKDTTHLAESLILAFEECLERDEKRGEVQINYLEKCIYFLLQRPDSTLETLLDLLSCKPEIFEEAEAYNPNFFNEDFAKPKNRTREALKGRISRLFNNPVLRNFFSGQSTFDLEQAINSWKVVIFDFGELSDLATKIAGKFIISYIKAVVRKRKKDHYPCSTFLMLDEAHVLMSGTFEYILSQLRWFWLHCILSHQYSKQLQDQKEAVRYNTAIKFVGGYDDPEDINAVINVPKNAEPLKVFDFYLKVKHQRLVKFKTPKKFILKRAKYEITDEQEEEMDKNAERKYYVVYDQTTPKKRSLKKLQPHQAIFDAPTPPFKIIVKEKNVQSV